MFYPADAIQRAKEDAMEWLAGESDAYPMSWMQEMRNNERRGYVLYDYVAPPILGYEALERDGWVIRMDTIHADGQERVHFRRIPGWHGRS